MWDRCSTNLDVFFCPGMLSDTSFHNTMIARTYAVKSLQFQEQISTQTCVRLSGLLMRPERLWARYTCTLGLWIEYAWICMFNWQSQWSHKSPSGCFQFSFVLIETPLNNLQVFFLRSLISDRTNMHVLFCQLSHKAKSMNFFWMFSVLSYTCCSLLVFFLRSLRSISTNLYVLFCPGLSSVISFHNTPSCSMLAHLRVSPMVPPHELTDLYPEMCSIVWTLNAHWIRSILCVLDFCMGPSSYYWILECK